MLTGMATAMVIWILFSGSKVHQNGYFVFLEVVINICIFLDFSFKLYLKGLKKFFKSWTNIFDAIVAASCIVTFLVMFFTSSVSLIMLEEVIEEMFFVLWCSLQYLRIILFLKHQKEAKSNAKPIELKDFYSDSFQNKEDIMFADDIEFNSGPKQSMEANGFEKVKKGKDKPSLNRGSSANHGKLPRHFILFGFGNFLCW